MSTARLACSVLFVPGSRPERFGSALSAGAGLVIFDLEDSVGPEHKEQARADVCGYLRNGHAGAVRINGIGTPWYSDDVQAVTTCASAVMIPKALPGPDLCTLGAALSAAGVEGIALVETAAGILGAEAIARTSGIDRLAFGSLDFAAEVNIDALDHETLAPARWALVLASAAGGLPAPVDGVWADVQDDAELRADTARARRLGYGGKLCIHPRQVAIVEDGFRPTSEEEAWARRILDGHDRNGRASVFSLDGGMVDKPVLDRARGILARIANARPPC